MILNVTLIYVVSLTKWYDLNDENCNNNNGVNGHGGDGGGGGGGGGDGGGGGGGDGGAGGVNEYDDKNVVAMMIQINMCIKGFLNRKISPLQANVQRRIKSKIYEKCK